MSDDSKETTSPADEALPAVTAGGREPDAYEARYMGGPEVFYRDKIAYPWYVHLFFALVSLLPVAVFFVPGAPIWVPLLQLGIIALTWSLLSTLRVAVSPDTVHVQYGLFGPKIPVASIKSCEPVKYNIFKYGGYGIRYSIFDGTWAFNMPGDRRRAVRLHYRTPKGALRKFVIASPDPHALARAINRARAGDIAPAPAQLAGEDDVVLDMNVDVEREEEAVPVEKTKSRT